jgi:hypothetical protein
MHRNPKWTGETAGSYHALLQSLTRRILMYLHGKEEDLLVTCKEDRVALLSFTNVIDILKEQHHGMSRPYYKTKKTTQCPEVVANSNSVSSSFSSSSSSSSSSSTSSSSAARDAGEDDVPFVVVIQNKAVGTNKRKRRI